MKKIVFLLIVQLFSFSAFCQELQNLKNTTFSPGEELKYKIKYGFITAAEATLKVVDTDVKFDNKSVYHIIAEGRTSGSFDIFYKVRNRYDSYIDKVDLTPYLYMENIHEAKYRRNDKARFYQDQKKIVANKGTFTGDGQTFDIVSAYYFARSLDLSKIKTGDKFVLDYFLQNKISSLEIQYVGKEKIKTALGHFNCLKFSPSLESGRIFREDSKLYLWITDDGNRIPVRAKADILVGSVYLEIQSATGLKYPL